MANCIFCKIAKGESPANIRFEDEKIVAFDDINPKAPIHVLIVPKKHVKSINDLPERDTELLGHMIMTAKKLAKELNVSKTGYKLVLNTGKEAGQLVDHLHLHLLGGKLLARMEV